MIVLHISRSWNPPHRGLGDQFYNRHSAGKGPLSVEQLRRVFTQSADNLERIRRFVRERVFLIHGGDGSISLSSDTAKMVLHVLPLVSFDSTLVVPIGHQLLATMNEMIPFGNHIIGSWDKGYNADGLIWKTNNTINGSYTQLFRNGIVECASNRIASVEKQFGATYVEQAVCFSLACIFSELRNINIISPVVISLSLVGIKGYSISKPRGDYGSNQNFSQDSLFLPEVTLEEFTSLLAEDKNESHKLIAPRLKEIFNALWQASGYSGSPNFNGDDWNPRD